MHAITEAIFFMLLLASRHAFVHRQSFGRNFHLSSKLHLNRILFETFECNLSQHGTIVAALNGSDYRSNHIKKVLHRLSIICNMFFIINLMYVLDFKASPQRTISFWSNWCRANRWCRDYRFINVSWLAIWWRSKTVFPVWVPRRLGSFYAW